MFTLINLFSKPQPMPQLGPFHAQIRVEQEGSEMLLSVPQFEALMQMRYVPALDFESFTIAADIAKRTEKLYRKGEMTRQQLWLGRYFEKEIREALIPDLILRWINADLGWGLFAYRDLKKMTFLATYTGKVRKRKRSDSKNAYCFEYIVSQGNPTPYVIDALEQGSLARYINHSSTPNLISALATLDNISHVVLYTAEPILKGTQLCYDYGKDYWAHRKAPVFLKNEGT